MIRYPNGKVLVKKSEKKVKSENIDYRNRGMSFEQDINITLDYYEEHGLALMSKRPTPINVVKVDYSRGARIIDAYFEKQSTTDYNGVYRGKYMDFEAKSTHNKTSFPLHNITDHQISHLKKVLLHGGIAFFIIEFIAHEKVFLLDASVVVSYYQNGSRKSIPYADVVRFGTEIEQGYLPRLKLLESIDEVYFHEKKD